MISYISLNRTLSRKHKNSDLLKKKSSILINTKYLLRIYIKSMLPLVSSLCVLSCESKNVEETDRNLRFELAKETGITFSNNLKSTIDLNILNYLYYYNGAGVAIGDFNNDGLDDIYFTSNQESDELYLNRGNLKFHNITSQSGIGNDTGWTTGVTIVDANNDGLLDIYISKVSGHLKLKGQNLLYINQGVSSIGIPTFKEEASKFGLDIGGFSSQTAFFDYDLDGDLDAFILRHSLYPNSNYGNGIIRKTTTDSLSGDLLLENKNGMYVNASAKANIYSSRIGYGLGISTGDVNDDGYPDIYVGNDFFENDYLYINQKDGTFKELNTTESILGHSSHFSMGNAIEDINNDGKPDIISVDMLPENLETFKASGQEYNYAILQNQLKYGYQPQFMQNTLHLNLGNNTFAETAFLSGIAATEWSWAPLATDFDNDGLKDLYVTNGILGASNDMDFVNFISNSAIQKQLGKNMDEDALTFIDRLPKKKTPNYFFKNTGNARFVNKSESWHQASPSFSNGASYSDLDNDGDLDIVVNNINDKAFIFKNNTSTDSLNSNYIHIKFEGSSRNRFGIGAIVDVYSNGKQQHFQNYTTTGYLSSRPPSIFVGLGTIKTIDSLKVVWPNNQQQVLKNIKGNQILYVKENNALQKYTEDPQYNTQPPMLDNTEVFVEYKHKDDPSIEFSRDPLIPYATTNLGPKISVGDLNSDGLEDIITVGGKNQITTYHLQQEGGSFIKQSFPNAQEHAINEDIHSIIFDANGDAKNDVFIVSGGNEFKSGKPLTPRFYLSTREGFKDKSAQFDTIFVNASKVYAVDLDNDRDKDIILTSNVYPREFGKTPQQYILKNDGQGNFTDITEAYSPDLQKLGNIYDIVWKDINKDGYIDAIVAGHWLPITILINNGTSLRPLPTSSLQHTNGWWNTLEIEDFDNDGDLDIMAGNWGLNTRLHPSLEEPVRLYRADFDANGQIDPVVTYFYNQKETTLATKDEMVKQLPFINKKFLSYTAFAKADIKELLGDKPLEKSNKKEAYEFASIYFENKGNNSFESHALPFLVQASSVQDILAEDFNNDGYLDALLVGNNHEISTQLGQLDGSHGVLLINDQKGGFKVAENQKFRVSGSSRSLKKIKIKDQTYYIVGRNNDTLLFLKSSNN